MDLTIQGHNLEVTDFIHNYVDKKIGKLDRYLPSLNEARVDIREQQSRNADQRYVVQVTLYEKRGTIIRGEERASELFTGVDLVVDNLHRQITRFKGKRQDRYQRQGSSAEEMWGLDTPVDFEEEEAGQIVRTKRFAMAPMSAEEAIDQMELLGHTFFVYYDVEEGGVNVVYRRHDGNYGLIVPELV